MLARRGVRRSATEAGDSGGNERLLRPHRALLNHNQINVRKKIGQTDEQIADRCGLVQQIHTADQIGGF